MSVLVRQQLSKSRVDWSQLVRSVHKIRYFHTNSALKSSSGRNEDLVFDPEYGKSLEERNKAHNFYTWTMQKGVSSPAIAKAEGIYMYTYDGKKIMDFNSQLMCSNIGHGNQKVIDSIKKQADHLPYIFPNAATEVRASVCEKLARLLPGGFNHFFFSLGGAEANENAIKMARQFTKRNKILARYRSFHGGTNAMLGMTGDPRRWAAEPGFPGIVHTLDPKPYDFRFGSTDAEITRNHLAYLEEIIMYEGPNNIAAMMIETVTGTNGILAPPDGYLPQLKSLLEKHDILLICDEVMAGFGRCGSMMAYERFGIVPDLVTMAKGLTSAYAPLGAIAVSDRVYEHFIDEVFWGGLTFNSHPLCMAAADACLDVIVEENLPQRAKNLEPIMQEEMARLKERHPSVREGRCIGLFGMVDIRKDSDNNLITPYGTTHPAMVKFAKYLWDNGLYTYSRWSHFTVSPPLIITEEELRRGFSIIDKALEITDDVFEG